MTTSINTHWLAKLLRFKPVSLAVINGELTLLTQEDNSSINLAQLDDLPLVTEGLLFSSLHVGETIINGLPKGKAGRFLAHCQKVRSWRCSITGLYIRRNLLELYEL